jgi:hypothetical protein
MIVCLAQSKFLNGWISTSYEAALVRIQSPVRFLKIERSERSNEIAYGRHLEA